MSARLLLALLLFAAQSLAWAHEVDHLSVDDPPMCAVCSISSELENTALETVRPACVGPVSAEPPSIRSTAISRPAPLSLRARAPPFAY